MGLVLLLGDSVFDNQPYLQDGQKSVYGHLQDLLPKGWECQSLATDGDKIEDVEGQTERLPEHVNIIFLSMGGNDLLDYQYTLTEDVGSVASALYLLSLIKEEFKNKYEKVLQRLSLTKIPVKLCTIYNPSIPEPEHQIVLETAISMFNDVIYRLGGIYGHRILELRNIFTKASDYKNLIEPSHEGGKKLATSIHELVDDFCSNLVFSQEKIHDSRS